MSTVLVLNPASNVPGSVTWEKAIKLVVSGKAVIHEADGDRLVRSACLTLPFPKIIRLIKAVYIKFKERKNNYCSKSAVLARDNHKCAYCGDDATTVDHIDPKSRGGKMIFLNAVACCRPCNQKKADKTPEEAGMILLWNPWEPTAENLWMRKVSSLK